MFPFLVVQMIQDIILMTSIKKLCGSCYVKEKDMYRRERDHGAVNTSSVRACARGLFTLAHGYPAATHGRPRPPAAVIDQQRAGRL